MKKGGALHTIANSLRGKFARDVFTVAGGAAGAQFIIVAFAPALTRLYGPQAFGLLGAFTAFCGILRPMAALCYPIAMVLPDNDGDALKIARLSFYISLIVSATIALAMFTGAKRLLSIAGAEAIAPLAFLIPLNVLFSGWFQIMQHWMIRKKQFTVKAKASILNALAINGAKATIGLFSPIATVLIVLTTLNNATQSILLSVLGKGKQAFNLFQGAPHDGASLVHTARRYYDFPVYRAPQVFINGLSQNLPVLMLASFFGPAAVGFYTVGKRILEVPSQFIGKSVGDVFYPKIAEAAHKRQNLTRLLIKATLALAMVGIVPYGTVVAIGPWLFRTIFGADWVTAGLYARWMAVWLFFLFINRPSLRAIPVLNAQGFHLVFTVVNILVRSAVLGGGFYFFASDLVTIALFGAAGALLNIALMAMIMIKCRAFDRERMMDAPGS